jgi:aspartate carbamoyltransferase catalytic subunit
MAEHADVPVINAGDGGHEHPTQTLCDLYTLRKEKGALKGLTVVLCGDLKNGRTIHSLVFALARFSANVVTLAANGMALPQYVIERLEREYGYGLAPVAANDLSTVVTETDALYLTPKQPHQLALFTQVDEVIQARLSSMATGLRYDAFYMTRKQKERMKDGASGSYPSIGADFLREQRFQDTVVMHPLPRVDELSPEVGQGSPRHLFQTSRLRRAGADGVAQVPIRTPRKVQRAHGNANRLFTKVPRRSARSAATLTV